MDDSFPVFLDELELETFDSKSLCPKCYCDDADTKYVIANSRRTTGKKFGCLLRTCTRCEYEWFEATVDSEGVD